MNQAARDTIVALATHARQVPAVERERFASRLRDELAGMALVLETCHRVEHADRQRQAELAALWRRLPELEPEARDAIEEMARHLATRLLREPLERLGRDSDGRYEGAVRDIFAL